MTDLTRRRVLRGMLNGGAVSVALPMLDCFLDGNGTALASGAPLPVRFGTWFWGLGMIAKNFTPTAFGRDFELLPESAPLAKVRQHINLFSNFNAYRDGAPNLCHYTGWVTIMSGSAPRDRGDLPGSTLDNLVADQIGRSTRFQQLTATAAASQAATGPNANTISYRNGTPNPAEWSPANFYQRLFGAGFQDPNAASFTPSPRVMARRSVLSGVMDQTKSLMKDVGAADRVRLEEYFTGLRSIENQLELQLQKPAPIAACRVPAPPEEPTMGMPAELVATRHALMTQLMVMAVACDQTRVFNMTYSVPFAATIKPGYEKPHHVATHEEPDDAETGYQLMVSWFTKRSMTALADYIEAFSRVREGDGSLLDRCLICGVTDHSYARIHSNDGIPFITAGRAGGRLKTGLHVNGENSAHGRIGLTMAHAMGLDLKSFGSKSNQSSRPITDVLA